MSEVDELIAQLEKDFEDRGYFLPNQCTPIITALRAAQAREQQLREALTPLVYDYGKMMEAHDQCPNQAEVYYGIYRYSHEAWKAALQALKETTNERN